MKSNSKQNNYIYVNIDKSKSINMFNEFKRQYLLKISK